MEIDFSKIHETPKGTDRFLKTFCRFEFALKEFGYLPPQGRAYARWNDFAKCLGDKFFERVRESRQAATLLSKPPSVQISIGRTLDFKSIDAPKNVQQLFEAIRRVRDNLFHGGKHGDPDEDRNERLIAEAQWVLEQALLSHLDVKSYFEGRY